MTHTYKTPWLQNFIDAYQRLSVNNLSTLDMVYHADITFIDPIHQLQGYKELEKYFEAMYQNLIACNFTIENVIEHPEQAAIYWTMNYQHPKLNKGAVISVQGHSHIKGGGDKVTYHRDYVDLGAMLYEHLPIFGKMTKWVKAKAATNE